MTDREMTAPLLLLLLAFCLTFYRLARGPSSVDRVLCLDFLALLTAALIALHSVWVGESIYIDVVLVLSMIAFFGTIVFARYIEWRSQWQRR